MRVLVIDDEPDVLLLCRVNLGYAGHEVREAPDGERGLEMAVSEAPDLILLDVMLPNRDGLSILRELAETEATRNIPVVILSAKAQAADQMLGLRTGAADYVTKPFSPAALAATVERVQAMTPSERDRHRDARIQGLEEPTDD